MNVSSLSISLDEFAQGIKTVSNEKLVLLDANERIGRAILASRGRFEASDKHEDRLDLLIVEAVRRGNPDLIKRGLNAACTSQGHPEQDTDYSQRLTYGDPTYSYYAVDTGEFKTIIHQGNRERALRDAQGQAYIAGHGWTHVTDEHITDATGADIAAFNDRVAVVV